MTEQQAEAILDAERVLYEVGEGGPDPAKGSAWYEYVKEAICRLRDVPLLYDCFTDLPLVQDILGESS